MKKITVITGSRAEYGLLFWLMKAIQDDATLQLQVIATGAHLSPEFGLTYLDIEKDFIIDKKVEMLLSADTPTAIAKSMGLALISLSEAFDELKPDLIIVLGDRFEIFAAASAALVARIPIAHIHGGEVTLGAIDESFRHAITKMSSLHFTATKAYQNRVIQMGEQPKNVFCTGAMAIENLNRLPLKRKQDIEEVLSFTLRPHNVLVTFHPETLGTSTSKAQFNELLVALNSLKDIGVIFTKANADSDGRIINQMIDTFVATHPKRAAVHTSLGAINYLSTMKHMDAVIGNSSSGIIEAPSLKVPSVNIGERQSGRIKADSVIQCPNQSVDIIKAIHKALSPEFKSGISNINNPYDHGNASHKIINAIKNVDLKSIIKKPFYDM